MYAFSGPAEVKGSLEMWRNRLQIVLIGVFVFLPWVKLNGAPVLLLNFFERHFIIFGFSFYSHDAPLLFFVLITIILVIFMITAIYGRLWCGWACPQTVFIHAVFNKLENIILGAYSKRFQFFSQAGGVSKIFKLTILYTLFFLISSVLAHSFVAYFIGTKTVMAYIADGPFLHLKSFSVVSIMSFLLFFNFTFFREKLCFFVCPYGRFQNALIDNNSLTVFYDKLRGEPRAKVNSKLNFSEQGDCIDCLRCVRVCPVKIDIRQGFQMECIACGKCIDACNEVMTKLERQPQLIRYETGNQKKITLHRFRLYLYTGLLLVFVSAFMYLLNQRSLIDVSISRAHINPFSSRITSIGTKVRINQIQIHLKNNSDAPVAIEIKLHPDQTQPALSLMTPAAQMQLEPMQDIVLPAFIERASSSTINQRFELVFEYKKLHSQKEALQIFKRNFDFIGGE
jgi:cytochrome c oxidase accessory protein FixG